VRDIVDEIALVVLDMAGTTVEDAGQVPAAFTETLRRHGVDVSAESLSQMRGASKREVIRRFVERELSGEESGVAARTERIFAELCETLAAKYRGEGVRPIPGAADTIAWLRARGIRVALNTGFDGSITRLILNALGWAKDTVDAVICGDDVSAGRPAPYLIFRAMETTGVTSVHRVANVGDTVLDLRAGHNAGVAWNVGVLSGAHTEEQLLRAPHTHLLPSVAALSTLWG
jgi:phosphonatase-like hydrolase